MPNVSESVEIAASPETAFTYIADAPERATTFIPGLNRISNVSQAQAGVGQSWDYEFNWFGLVISGNSKCTEYTKASVYQFKTVTGNPSTWTVPLSTRRQEHTADARCGLRSPAESARALCGWRCVGKDEPQPGAGDRQQPQGTHRALIRRSFIEGGACHAVASARREPPSSRLGFCTP